MDTPQKLFGTDGIRGLANAEPVTPETALKLGRAAAHIISRDHSEPTSAAMPRPKIVIGRDTRISGPMLENALIAGITSLGVDVVLAGVLPTPGIACLTRTQAAAAGIVISASHNHFADNGIKFFRHDGFKFKENIQNEIESLIANNSLDPFRPTGGNIGEVHQLDSALDEYIDLAKASFPAHLNLKSLTIAIDCAHGAAYQATPAILKQLGATCHTFNTTPNGTNINLDCGSTYPEEVQRRVRETNADVGLAHDGDADRLLLCDENGEIIDGDEIMAIAATQLLAAGQLPANTLVATIMSNAGLDEAVAAAGGKVIRTQVGDRYVIEEMLRSNLMVGGEQSGHMIFRNYSTTGDGIVSALQILRFMIETGKPLSELKKCLNKYPQAQRYLPVREKPPLESLTEVNKLIAEAESNLAGNGRVLLRYSGTEAKVRLLIEGRDAEAISRDADRIAKALTAAIGTA